MPLRSDNNNNDEVSLLTAIRLVALGYPTPNTALALNSVSGTGMEVAYIQREYDMISTGTFPALLLQAGAQGAGRMSQHTFAGQFTAILDLYNRYDAAATEFDAIRADLALDLNRMRSNIETNDSLATNGAALTVSLVKYTLSPYEGIMRNIGNLQFIYRRLILTFNTLDYDAVV